MNQNDKNELMTQGEQLMTHTHNKIDSLAISFDYLLQRKGYAVCTLQGTSAATSSNYGVFFIIPFSCVVTGITEVHSTAGTDGSAVTLQVEKLTGTTASGSGSSLLLTAFNLKTTANTVQTGVLINPTTNPSPLQFSKGDRLGLVPTGTLTSLAGVTVVVQITY